MAVDGWYVRPLGDLTDNFDSMRIPVKKADRRPGPYPYYGASGIVDYVDQYIFDGEYLLIAEDGENLRTRQTPVAFLAHGKYWVNNHAHIVRGNTKADTRFLMYALAATEVSGYLTGSTMPKLTQGNMNRIPILTPPLHEQKAIAHVLGTLDDKIELNRRINETLEAMARAIFKSWFVDFDPVRANAEGRRLQGLDPAIQKLFPDRFQDSPFGPIPKGWQVRPLDEIATYLNGLACQKYPPNESEELPVIKIRELKQGITDNSDRAAADVPDKYIVEDGNVLFSWSGSLLVKVWAGGRGVLNQHVFKVLSDEFPKWFYLYWTEHHVEEFQRIAADKATTMGHIQRRHLSEALTVVPDDALMNAMTQVMAPLVDRQIANATQARTLGEVRDALLPKLLSGEVRVGDAPQLAGKAT